MATTGAYNDTLACWLLELLATMGDCQKCFRVVGPHGVMQLRFTYPGGSGIAVLTPFTTN